MTIDSAKGFVPNYSWFSMSRVLSFAYVYTRPLRALIRVYIYIYAPRYIPYMYVTWKARVRVRASEKG